MSIENNNTSTSGESKIRILLALIGFFGVFIGAYFGMLNANKNHAISVGEMIIDKVHFLTKDSEQQGVIIKEVFKSMAKGNTEDLSRILEDIKAVKQEDIIVESVTLQNTSVQTSESKAQNQPTKTAQVEDTMQASLSWSKSDWQHHESFRSNNIFLLIESKQEIKDMDVDWDNGEGFRRIKLQPADKTGAFYTSHYYIPSKTVRNIRIRTKFNNGTQATMLKTIFTYL